MRCWTYHKLLSLPKEYGPCRVALDELREAMNADHLDQSRSRSTPLRRGLRSRRGCVAATLCRIGGIF